MVRRLLHYLFLRVWVYHDRLTLDLGGGLLELRLVFCHVGHGKGGVLSLGRHLRDQLEHLILHGFLLLILDLLMLVVLRLWIDWLLYLFGLVSAVHLLLDLVWCLLIHLLVCKCF